MLCIDKEKSPYPRDAKEVFIPNSKIYELADGMSREKGCQVLKQRLDSRTGLPGVAMIPLESPANRKFYQVFCGWMPAWHLEHLDCALDISYQDDGRGVERVLMVMVRKKYKHSIQSSTKVFSELDLAGFDSHTIKRMAEDALIKMDSQNKGEGR